MPAAGARATRPVLASPAGFGLGPERHRRRSRHCRRRPVPGRAEADGPEAAATLALQARLVSIGDALPSDARRLVRGARAVHRIDSPATAMPDEFRAGLAARRVRLGAAEMHTEGADLLQDIGPEPIFDDLDDARRASGASGANSGGSA
jgi:hypothetical protein